MASALCLLQPCTIFATCLSPSWQSVSEHERLAVHLIYKYSRTLGCFSFPLLFCFFMLLYFISSHLPSPFFMLLFSWSHQYWHIHVAIPPRHSPCPFFLNVSSCPFFVCSIAHALDLVAQYQFILAISTMIHISTITSYIHCCLFLSVRPTAAVAVSALRHSPTTAHQKLRPWRKFPGRFMTQGSACDSGGLASVTKTV